MELIVDDSRSANLAASLLPCCNIVHFPTATSYSQCHRSAEEFPHRLRVVHGKRTHRARAQAMQAILVRPTRGPDDTVALSALRPSLIVTAGYSSSLLANVATIIVSSSLNFGISLNWSLLRARSHFR